VVVRDVTTVIKVGNVKVPTAKNVKYLDLLKMSFKRLVGCGKYKIQWAN
tara:strand:- start:579 stop:725 length:147 start_codon:yes stop_codon:yes gene_type:complete